ncbi:MAG: CDP-glycerol glycerophosphotransferase family protein [Nocardioides sp.]|uniref:bifunctional glycosyltransferase/CDP-glycerol:glycerophosphate glycerophosphotransferase n=1 Tax=Nocardioides sp. TaxID=35761 RepID=UPI0039E48EA0
MSGLSGLRRISAESKRLLRGATRGIERRPNGLLRNLRRNAEVTVRRATGRGSYVPGLLSVVVPAYGVEEYIAECLDSLRAQHYLQLEIIVVDDGTPDASAEIAAEIAREDRRIRVVRRPNGGLSAARNTGVEHAVGEFLVFVDADDTVGPQAFSAAIESLAESGSDFAVTNYDRLARDGKPVPAAPWIRRAHEQAHIGVTLAEFPDAMVNAVAWSKVYRRRFWDAAGLSFPVGRLYEDQPVSMAAFGTARAFDVLPTIGVHWRVRGDGSSISQAAATVTNLAEHNEAVRTSLAALREAGHPEAADHRVLQLLANNMPYFVRHIAVAGQDFWNHLREGIGELTHGITHTTYLREVPAMDKVLYELIVTDRREDAIAILENYGRDVRRYPTRVGEDGVHVVLPYADQVAEEATLLADREIDLVHRLLHVAWEDDLLRLDGWAYLNCIDLAEHPQTLELTLTDGDRFRRSLTVSAHPQPRADVTGRHLYSDYTPSGFEAILDTSDLPDGDYQFELRVSVAGLSETGPLNQPAVAGSAGVAHSRILPGGRAMVLRHGRRRAAGAVNPLALRVSSRPAWATATRWDGDTLEIDFEATDPLVVQLTHIDRDRPFVATTATRTRSGWRARLDLSGLGAQLVGLSTTERRRPLRVRVQTGGGAVPLLAPAGLAASPGVPDRDATPRVLTRAGTGELELFDWLPVATGYRLTGDDLSVAVSHAEELPGTPVLRSKVGDVPGTVQAGPRPGISTLRFSMTRTHWGTPGLALPTDRYLIGLTDGASDEADWVPVTVAPQLLADLPAEHVGTRHRARTHIAPTTPPTFAIQLEPPLGDDERGRRNQRRLAEQSRVVEASDDSVFFRSLYGEVTNCNGLGVHTELRRRGAELSLIWSVADHSVPVPEGGLGLVEGTTAWHRALAQARYHLVNVHQLDWFTKPTGQVMIETMHGYPYKVMGHEWWDKGGFPRHQVESFDRRAREWDYFVSPASYATPLLRAAFLEPAGSTAEVLEIGYPRNDILLTPEGNAVRRRTRELLGIDEDTTVVLYAPTFRDYMSADDMTAKRVDFLEADRVVAALENVVVLLRGHAFHSRAKDDVLDRSASIIDVTDYPDVNDLVLASDVGVLDYSSLRFDYGVTDKPMIFLVPDLAKYHEARGGVIAYEPTAPGPFATSTTEVVAWLADLPRLSEEYAADRARFRAEYADLEDGHASARLVDAVFVPRGDAPAVEA